MQTLPIVLPTLILIVGVIDDLRSRKVHNWLILLLLGVALATTTYFNGWNGLKMGGLSLTVALVSCLPLVLTKIMGAGDMKLLMVFGIVVDPMTVVWVLVYSFVWGAILGVAQALLNKDGFNLLMNTFNIATGGGKQINKSKLHKVPYTVALFFGWLTQLSLTGFGGLIG